MINKSATKACEIAWANGNATVLWVGHNRNTGETIVWQVVWKTYPGGTWGPNRSKQKDTKDDHATSNVRTMG